jgi:hypothetical protein
LLHPSLQSIRWFPTPLRLLLPLVLVEEKGRSRRLQCGWWVLSEHAGRDQVRVSTLPLEDHIRGLVHALVLHPWRTKPGLILQHILLEKTNSWKELS